MRFLILSQYFHPEIGAAQVRLEALARELQRRGHEVEVVTGMPNYPEGRIHDSYRRSVMRTEMVNGITIRRTWLYSATGSGFRRMMNYCSFAVMSLLGLARCRRPDVIFVESPPPFLMLPASLAGLIWRRPVIMNVADLWPDTAVHLGLLNEGIVLRLLRSFERWSYGRARWVCAVTDGVRRVLVEDKSVPTEKVVDLPNGVDTNLFTPSEGDRSVLSRWGLEERRVLLYAGTVGYGAGVETAIDAMRSLAVTHPDAHLLIVGGGSEWEVIAERVRSLELENVTMGGTVPLDSVARLLNVSFAALTTLRDSPLFEGTRPSKLFPALAAGVPIIYSGSGEGARLVADHGAGLVLEPEDSAALAAAARQLLDDPGLAEQLGARGRLLAESRFSWPEIVDVWLSQLGYENEAAPPVVG